jgi:hypothetical protein
MRRLRGLTPIVIAHQSYDTAAGHVEAAAAALAVAFVGAALQV